MSKSRSGVARKAVTIKARASLWAAAPAFLWQAMAMLVVLVVASWVAAHWHLAIVTLAVAALACVWLIVLAVREWLWIRGWRYKLTPYWLRVAAPGFGGGVAYISLLDVADCRVERDAFPSGVPMYGHVALKVKPRTDEPVLMFALRDPESMRDAIKANAKAWRAEQVPGSDKKRHLKRYHAMLREAENGSEDAPVSAR